MSKRTTPIEMPMYSGLSMLEGPRCPWTASQLTRRQPRWAWCEQEAVQEAGCQRRRPRREKSHSRPGGEGDDGGLDDAAADARDEHDNYRW